LCVGVCNFERGLKLFLFSVLPVVALSERQMVVEVLDLLLKRRFAALAPLVLFNRMSGSGFLELLLKRLNCVVFPFVVFHGLLRVGSNELFDQGFLRTAFPFWLIDGPLFVVLLDFECLGLLHGAQPFIVRVDTRVRVARDDSLQALLPVSLPLVLLHFLGQPLRDFFPLRVLPGTSPLVLRLWE